MSDDVLNVIKRAFPRTLPVMAGYIFLGIAYGVAMVEHGFGVGWVAFICLMVYGGSMQFAMIAQLAQPFSPVTMALMALLIQARHIFYGLSMLKPYEGAGKHKPYLIFALTDETYSLVVSGAPEGVDKYQWYTAVSVLDQVYWVTGCVLGALIGAVIPVSLLTGIDFAMTALFTVIVTEQTMDAIKAVKAGTMTKAEALFPPLTGGLCTLLALLAVGTGSFLLLGMTMMLCCFVVRWMTLPQTARTGEGRHAA